MSFNKGLLFFILAMSFSMGRASEHSEHAKHSEPEVPAGLKVVKIREIPRDFLLPGQLWDLLLKSDKPVEHTAVIEEAEAPSETLLFSELQVELVEKTPGVLRYPIIRFEFPKGGGKIDLSDWTTGERGTFFVRFRIDKGPAASEIRTYHLSQTKKRKAQGRIFGGGCRSFYDLKNLNKTLFGDGIPVNTTMDFHSSTLGGHFIFKWMIEDAHEVTQVQFVDSKRYNLFCSQGTRKSPEPGS